MSNEQMITYSTDHGEVKLSPVTIKRYLVSGNGNVTDQEVMMFIAMCRYQKLNPWLREAYLIKFGNSPATMVTGKEVFTKRAAKLKECAGWESGIVLVAQDGTITRRAGTLVLQNETLVGGWARVHRHDWKVPTEAEVSLKEYMRTDSTGRPQSSWAKMPATMIKKVAIVQALRDAFPEDFQGLYSPEEMPMPVDVSNLADKPVDVHEQYTVPVEAEVIEQEAQG